MVDDRTRERLTGAAILVAVIVLLVPELLSRPKHPGPEQAAAVDEAPLRSYKLSLSDSSQSATPVPVVAAAPTSAAPAMSAPTAPAAPGSADGRRPASPSADGAARIVEAPRPAPRSAAPAIEGAAQPRGSATRRQSAASAGNGDKVEKVAHAHAESAPGSGPGAWAVQVGSFGSRENADRLVQRLRLKGYGAFITESPSRGRTWYRVRVGPERTRAAADAAATRLRAAGLRGAVAQPK